MSDTDICKKCNRDWIIMDEDIEGLCPWCRIKEKDAKLEKISDILKDRFGNKAGRIQLIIRGY